MSQQVIDQAYSFLRSHTRGDLRFDEHLRPIKYVILPDGRLAAPVMVAMIEAVDSVLFVPEYSEGSLELQVTLAPFEERGSDGAFADRWRIYHGEPQDVRWAFLNIDAARHGEMVVDGDALMRPNPLAADESRFCRQMNQEHADDLRRLCDHFAGIQIENPVMVGIDPLGLDVRSRFDVIRVAAIQPMPTAHEAQQVLATMSRAAVNGA